MKTTSATGKRGFTFIELLVVILIIGVFTGVALPGFRKTFDNLELDNFSNDIYYLSQYLKSAAISEGRIHCLGIDLGKGEFKAFAKGEVKLEKLKGRFGKPYKAAQGVKIAVSPQDKTQVYFYPDGSVDAVTITLKNRNLKQVVLSIRGALGEIKIQ